MKLVYATFAIMITMMVGAGVILASTVRKPPAELNAPIERTNPLIEELEELKIKLQDRERRLAEAKSRLNYWHHHAWKAERNLLPWQR